MLKNYCTVAIRNLLRNKVFSFINIFGLAIGLATCLLITLFVTDELGYDRFNEKADRIFRVNADFKLGAVALNERLTPAALGPAMVNEYPQIEKMVRMSQYFDQISIRKGKEVIVESDAYFADSTLFDVFTIPMLAGDPHTALTAPNTMVISQQMAAKYFTGIPLTSVIGKTLFTDNKINYTITGVIKEMPSQSHIHFSFIKAMVGDKQLGNKSWLGSSYVTYLLARPGTSRQYMDNCLREATRKHAEPQMRQAMGSSFDDLAKKGDYYRFVSMPLTKIHLYSTLVREAEPSGNIQYIYIFIVTGVCILLLACVNFMNLSTARSADRSKEVGMRKVLGSYRRQLIVQFLTESVITSCIAWLLALGMVVLLLPLFNNVSGKTFTPAILLSRWLLLSFAGSILVGLLAGSYPAFFLSAFRPVQVLKGRLAIGFKGSWLRNSLVVFQFTTAIILIVSTLVIYSQLNYIRHKQLGYNREQLLVLKNTEVLGVHAQTFRNQVLKADGVQSVSMAEVLPISNVTETEVFFRDAAMSKSMAWEQWDVDANYIPTLGMQIVKGRNFSPLMPTDSQAVVINETAAAMLGYANPLNQNIYEHGEDGSIVHRIVGVVKDFNVGSLRNKIPPVVLDLSDDKTYIVLRISTNNIPGTIAQVKTAYQLVNSKMAGQPFLYSFMDEDFNELYESEQHMGSIFISFAVLAILIACLGLFGLVTYAAEQRTKEISIRKILGASVRTLVQLLSRDFLQLILIAILIAFPIGWWAMNRWLRDFAYSTSIHWWVFAIAGMLALFITLVTIGIRTIKTARENPVKRLKVE